MPVLEMTIDVSKVTPSVRYFSIAAFSSADCPETSFSKAFTRFVDKVESNWAP